MKNHEHCEDIPVTPTASTTVLAVDVGGTKTMLGLFSPGTDRLQPAVMKSYPSQEAACLDDIVEAFLTEHATTVAGACVAVPGPVTDGRCQVTNLPWVVSEESLSARFAWQRVSLVNDLGATAMAIPILPPDELTPLSEAQVRPDEPRAVIAPGTGLGQAALLPTADGASSALASEGGHVDFAPQSELETELWQFLSQAHGHVSVERVVSGMGIRNIYAFLRSTGRYTEPDWLRAQLAEQDPAAVISEVARAGTDPMCVETMNLFVSAFGAAAGNFALSVLATGGVYLGGGIPPKILELLGNGRFLASFTAKGRFKELMEGIAIQVIRNPNAALYGAARVATIATQRGS